ncbi:hypothetical protein L207DRAFT_641993 [Hyaloscypha variabilis F]|uniref:Uncharacterized protein n=1 Tax=Hyaloscypha variabilis (strain UAMH 11265 / GT02V1 / F) TaxID=1149755 RepID=A0A2J6QUF3_HYAVF|nr:hypothetical protein L207DRAFT_641993 [Hyaloscypha variabilis F]
MPYESQYDSMVNTAECCRSIPQPPAPLTRMLLILSTENLSHRHGIDITRKTIQHHSGKTSPGIVPRRAIGRWIQTMETPRRQTSSRTESHRGGKELHKLGNPFWLSASLRAVFTGGPVHSPMMPPPIQQQLPQNFTLTVSVTVNNPQFPGLHAPMVAPVQRQPPPKLTEHHLSLLNAFKGKKDDPSDSLQTKNDLPLRAYELYFVIRLHVYKLAKAAITINQESNGPNL